MSTAGTGLGESVSKGIGGAEKMSTEVEMETRVISPELRGLLSRKIVVLDKLEVKEHGGGTA